MKQTTTMTKEEARTLARHILDDYLAGEETGYAGAFALQDLRNSGEERINLWLGTAKRAYKRTASGRVYEIEYDEGEMALVLSGMRMEEEEEAKMRVEEEKEAKKKTKPKPKPRPTLLDKATEEDEDGNTKRKSLRDLAKEQDFEVDSSGYITILSAVGYLQTVKAEKYSVEMVCPKCGDIRMLQPCDVFQAKMCVPCTREERQARRNKAKRKGSK